MHAHLNFENCDTYPSPQQSQSPHQKFRVTMNANPATIDKNFGRLRNNCRRYFLQAIKRSNVFIGKKNIKHSTNAWT